MFGNFRDNWDLAAREHQCCARAGKAGNISTDRMKAVSFGESKPITQTILRRSKKIEELKLKLTSNFKPITLIKKLSFIKLAWVDCFSLNIKNIFNSLGLLF